MNNSVKKKRDIHGVSPARLELTLKASKTFVLTTIRRRGNIEGRQSELN